MGGLHAYFCCLVTKSCATLCDDLDYSMDCRLSCPPPSPRVCSNMSTALMMAFNHLILCHPLLLLSLIFPSIRVFSNKLALRIR